MADTTAFIVEAVIVLFFSVIVSGFSVRQLHFDISRAERLRPLTVCHYLIAPACVLQIIGNVDPQGGIEVYSEAFSVFCGQLRTMILLSAAQALAVGFVSSYQLITQGAKQLNKNVAFFAMHAFINVAALIFFLVQMFTRYVPVGIVSRAIMSLYSLLVCSHTIYSAIKVRNVLIEERTRTGKYSEGIKKLGRVVILVAVLCIIGNSTMMVSMKSTIELVQTTNIYEDKPVEKFSAFNLFSDCAGLLALAALTMGSWNVRASENQENKNNSKPTPPATSSLGRKSTLKAPKSRELPSDTSTETSVELATLTPPNSYVPQSSDSLHMEDPSPASSDAIHDDDSKKRQGKQGYAELDV